MLRLDSLQLAVPTVATPDGLLRTSDNDGKPVPLVPRPVAVEPDWSREECDSFAWLPGQQLMRAYRDHAAGRELGGVVGKVQQKLAGLRHRFWSAMSGADLPLSAQRIAGGLMLPHPNGVVVHPGAEIGANCLLSQQVTLGTGPRAGLPKLGRGVEIGPGAQVLGGVTVGDYARIPARAVVTEDVPARSIASLRTI